MADDYTPRGGLYDMINTLQNGPRERLGSKCYGCGGEAADEEHLCPFAQEIHNNDSECNCCDECARQCALDI